jgi:hypothetical protein
MPRAKQFQHLGAVAVNVLARLEAKKQVKEQLRAQGIRRPSPTSRDRGTEQGASRNSSRTLRAGPATRVADGLRPLC